MDLRMLQTLRAFISPYTVGMILSIKVKDDWIRQQR